MSLNIRALISILFFCVLSIPHLRAAEDNAHRIQPIKLSSETGPSRISPKKGRLSDPLISTEKDQAFQGAFVSLESTEYKKSPVVVIEKREEFNPFAHGWVLPPGHSREHTPEQVDIHAYCDELTRLTTSLEHNSNTVWGNYIVKKDISKINNTYLSEDFLKNFTETGTTESMQSTLHFTIQHNKKISDALKKFIVPLTHVPTKTTLKSLTQALRLCVALCIVYNPTLELIPQKQ